MVLSVMVSDREGVVRPAEMNIECMSQSVVFIEMTCLTVRER
jgi:hypothetical protein